MTHYTRTSSPAPSSSRGRTCDGLAVRPSSPSLARRLRPLVVKTTRDQYPHLPRRALPPPGCLSPSTLFPSAIPNAALLRSTPTIFGYQQRLVNACRPCTAFPGPALHSQQFPATGRL